ncbi:hypothetical protein [Tenacibaculum sp. M341]|uniref:hypothetical protein n=1 Tax=Tenacibaculum sp. M341 TaxID=2530339 RepID=UPI00104ACF46|nr:hypothetical protein [Tenacibaculum sp. M341]TCI90294.1 hypothetical protein EYW44_13745 [Tenacibaculum sp. M341]
MKFLNKIFKKKKNIQEYIDYIDDKKINFQLDIGSVIHSEKQNRVDIQVFRQEVIKDFNFEVLEEYIYMIMLSFNDEKINNSLNYKKFKNSSLFDESLYVNLYGKTYLMRKSS